jgi:hypothetical protein
VLFQLFAPQGLECPAAAVERIIFGKIRIPAKQVAKINFARRYARIFSHLNPLN